MQVSRSVCGDEEISQIIEKACKEDCQKAHQENLQRQSEVVYKTKKVFESGSYIGKWDYVKHKKV